MKQSAAIAATLRNVLFMHYKLLRYSTYTAALDLSATRLPRCRFRCLGLIVNPRTIRRGTRCSDAIRAGMNELAAPTTVCSFLLNRCLLCAFSRMPPRRDDVPYVVVAEVIALALDANHSALEIQIDVTHRESSNNFSCWDRIARHAASARLLEGLLSRSRQDDILGPGTIIKERVSSRYPDHGLLHHDHREGPYARSSSWGLMTR
jgi:hypothetical protein